MSTAIQARPRGEASGDNRESLRFGSIDFMEPKYGFITPEDGGRDIFLRWTVVQKCKLRKEELAPGTRVKFRDKPGEMGPNPQATFIELA